MEENIVKNGIEENVTVDSSVAVEKSAEEVERDLADEVFLDEVKKVLMILKLSRKGSTTFTRSVLIR